MDYRGADTVSMEFVMVARAPVRALVHEMAARAAGDISTVRVTGDGTRLTHR